MNLDVIYSPYKEIIYVYVVEHKSISCQLKVVWEFAKF